MTSHRDALVRARAALEPFADVARAIDEADAYAAAQERKRAAEHGEPPMFSPRASDALRVRVLFYAYAGPEVGDVEIDEYEYTDLTVGDFRKALAALALIDTVLAATPAEGEWQDISTAPRDGTWIMLGYYLEGGGGGEPSIAFWHSTRQLWCGNEGFLNATGYFSPTHWQPLPAPPAKLAEPS